MFYGAVSVVACLVWFGFGWSVGSVGWVVGLANPYEECIPAISQCNACGKFSSRKYNFIIPDVCVLCELKHAVIRWLYKM
jgi:hypothetical protein